MNYEKNGSNGNILKPLIDALWVVGPVIWDKWGNLCYRVVTGRSFGTVVVEEDDEIQTANLKTYEYIPVEQLIEVTRDLKVVTYLYEEGGKTE